MKIKMVIAAAALTVLGVIGLSTNKSESAEYFNFPEINRCLPENLLTKENAEAKGFSNYSEVTEENQIVSIVKTLLSKDFEVGTPPYANADIHRIGLMSAADKGFVIGADKDNCVHSIWRLSMEEMKQLAVITSKEFTDAQ